MVPFIGNVQNSKSTETVSRLVVAKGWEDGVKTGHDW